MSRTTPPTGPGARVGARGASASQHDAAPTWARGALEWRQPHARRSEWELLADGTRIGALLVRGIFREETSAEGPSGTWRFRGGWTGHTEIALGDASTPAARFEPRWTGGMIHGTATGLRFRWSRHGFWNRPYVLATESESACVTLRPASGLTRLGGTVTIATAGQRLTELEPLVFLAWRLVLSDHRS